MAYHIRPTWLAEIDKCVELVRENWGDDSANRCLEQFAEVHGRGKYDPKFFTCLDDDAKFVGFCAIRRTMLMNGAWECIWVAVDEEHHGKGAGSLMTQFRIDLAKREGGAFITLVTQKPKYFNRFGFVTSQHLGNRWVLMTCQLKLADMDTER